MAAVAKRGNSTGTADKGGSQEGRKGLKKKKTVVIVVKQRKARSRAPAKTLARPHVHRERLGGRPGGKEKESKRHAMRKRGGVKGVK